MLQRAKLFFAPLVELRRTKRTHPHLCCCPLLCPGCGFPFLLCPFNCAILSRAVRCLRLYVIRLSGWAGLRCECVLFKYYMNNTIRSTLHVFVLSTDYIYVVHTVANVM